MAHIRPSRVWMNCTVSGTGGNIVPTTTKTAYRSIASQLANGDTCEYVVEAVDSLGNPTGAWEEGIGTLNGSGELTRFVLYSSNANSLVNFDGGGLHHVMLVSSQQSEDRPRVDVFTTQGLTSNGYAKPVWAESIEVVMVSSGGPGGSGRKGAAASVRCGGGGGGGGAYGRAIFPALAITSTVDIHVGNARPGAASVTANSTNGNTGTAQNVAPFGYSYFGRYLQVIGGAPGNGGTNAAGTGGAGGSGMPQVSGQTGGTAGGTASTTGGVGVAGTAANGPGASGGGSGGGITSADAASNGGAGGAVGNAATLSGLGVPGLTGGSAGVSGGASPGAGNMLASGLPTGGSGGGGGASSISGNAQAGAAGGNYGGGGGGGGASVDSVGDSGAGGAGAQGIVVVITS